MTLISIIFYMDYIELHRFYVDSYSFYFHSQYFMDSIQHYLQYCYVILVKNTPSDVSKNERNDVIQVSEHITEE